MATSPDDPRLARLAAIALALPEATSRNFGQHTQFQVRAKTFAFFLNDHHGDDIIAVSCKAPPGVNTMLAHSEPERFYIPAYIGPKGWMALRLDTGAIDWDEVTAFVTDSYRLIAPKRLAALVPAPAD